MSEKERDMINRNLNFITIQGETIRELRKRIEILESNSFITESAPISKKVYDEIEISFKKGDLVTYIPTHACGDKNHKDCENGVVFSENAYYVFVKYDNADMKMETGDEPYTVVVTKRKDLIRRFELL